MPFALSWRPARMRNRHSRPFHPVRLRQPREVRLAPATPPPPRPRRAAQRPEVTTPAPVRVQRAPTPPDNRQPRLRRDSPAQRWTRIVMAARPTLQRRSRARGATVLVAHRGLQAARAASRGRASTVLTPQHQAAAAQHLLPDPRRRLALVATVTGRVLRPAARVTGRAPAARLPRVLTRQLLVPALRV